jgi:hypothetical protein
MMRLLTPAGLVLLCWSLTILIAIVALSDPERFDLLPMLMAREGIDRRAFGLLGGLWIVVALSVYLAGDLAARVSLPRPRPFVAGVDLDRAARLTFTVNLALILVTLFWIGLTAVQMGGLRSLVLLAGSENRALRAALLDNKLFAGMRLLYAALPATGCLAAGILAADRGDLSRRGRFLCRLVLVANLAALAILPVVMSQRLLLLQFLLSAWLVTCLVRGRIVGLGKAVLAAALFLGVWVLREAVTNPTISRGAVDLGMQKLAFYFVNDLWNSVAPIDADIAPTFGVLSFNGILFFTFTDGLVANAMADRLAATELVRGGGEFSLLTAPFVDFGPVGAAVFIAVAAFAFRVIWHLGRQSLGWAVIYGQVGAALLYSSHSLYVTHQNCLFSILLMALILRWARRPPKVMVRRASLTVVAASSDGPGRVRPPLPRPDHDELGHAA